MSAYSRKKRAGKLPKAKPDRRTPPAIDRRVQPKATPKARTPRRLPWEGADAPDHYDHGIARMMRETPGRWSS
ncbi:hypothetical protein ACIRN4_06190 [Pimelobacter simplex]|uniref:Uncharacterized protein n=1 Tax=Nocardioides simplex TaxID=2045 RepID=A0A7J5DT67_NOCSI|nr:hypothetical protein [Pimelobacter simplex]KAB2808348.1 hypothetical protein F9L07_22800 [Pimelobacter simplex]